MGSYSHLRFTEAYELVKQDFGKVYYANNSKQF